MKFIKRTQRFISDYLPVKISKEDIRFIIIFLFFIFAVIFLVSFIEYHRQKFWRLTNKISGFLMFSNTPLFHPHKNPLPWTFCLADNYCKISVIGGLAQLVEQRTRSISKISRDLTLCHPNSGISRSFFGSNFLQHTTTHHT